MSYIQKILNDDEKVLVIAPLHWVYMLRATLWLVFFVALGWGIDYMLLGYAPYVPDIYEHYANLPVIRYFPLSPFALLSVLTGLWIFADLFILYHFSEVVLTERRVIYKHGMIHVELEESDLHEIHAEDINHGLLGYFIGYGTIELDCRFVNNMKLPAIRHPIKFVQALQKARSKSHDALERDVIRL